MTGYKLFALQGIARDRKDKSTAITFTTLELSNKDFQIIRDCNNMGGELVFVPENAGELAKIKGKAGKKKSPSYRLRMAMMDWYADKHGNIIDFQQFYENWIEKKIRQFRGEE